jgi:phosphatidylglycerophosphate synthase
MTNEGKAAFVNAITFARLPLVFLWAFLAIWHEFSSSITVVVFAALSMLIAGLTDLWDGKLARKWGVVSALGKMADPLMDKVFYVVTFPALAWLLLKQGESVHSLVMLVFAILYILRDLWVTFLRAVGSLYGADGAAMWLGKVRTALSFPGAGWIYAYLCFRQFEPFRVANVWTNTVWPLSVIAVEAFLGVLTFVSLVTYTRSYMPYLKRALERKENL